MNDAPKGLRQAMRSAPARRPTALALGAIPGIELASRRFGGRRVKSWLTRLTPPRRSLREDAERARLLAGLVELVAERGIAEGTCLSKSLLLFWLLRLEGLAGELRVGVQVPSPPIIAHAWVEVAGVPVNDAADVGERYAAFSAPL